MIQGGRPRAGRPDAREHHVPAMNGHHYIGLRHRRTLQRVEIAVPAQLTTDTIGLAAQLEALWPDWIHLPGDVTWRASFDQRAMPGNSQPDYHGPAAVRA